MHRALPVAFRPALTALLLCFAAAGNAAEDEQREALVDLPTLWAAAPAVLQPADPTDPKPSLFDPPLPDTAPAIEKNKSYAIPALEIVGFDFLLNMFDRAFLGDDFKSNASTIRRNLRSKWVTDSDSFTINQLGHPYQGSMYHGFARSAGLNFWESLGYTFAGSAFWEIFGEATPPSRNDQVMTGIGGSFLGESLFRMSSLLLEKGGGLPPAWREVAAAVISPPTGFNRYAFGNRFDAIFASHSPAYYSRLALGISGTTRNVPGASTEVKRNEGLADFSLDYGLPGKPGYQYNRPFDYFTFQATATTANGLENVFTRGLLLGRPYEGEHTRGVWGLYGSYDYFAPQAFRVSNTALALGTTAQTWLSNAWALQATAMGGAGYTAVGTINSVSERDNHYGIAPQALVALRLIYGDKASLDVTAREYFVSKVGGGALGGHDNIVRADSTLTFRIHKQHAVAIKYLWNRRDAEIPTLGDRTQTRSTLGVFYTLLGHDRFGAVEWR